MLFCHQFGRKNWMVCGAKSFSATVLSRRQIATNNQHRCKRDDECNPLSYYNSNNNNTITTTLTATTSSSIRFYVSRAHPKPRPVYGIQAALQLALDEVAQRKHKRALKWDKFRGQKERNGVKIDEGPYRNMDETVEFTVNLNLDTRKPGQMLRGTVSLPHGSGKRLECIVFTTDPDVEREALAAGAKYAGGLDLIDQIVRGQVPVDSIQRALATPNMTGYLSKSAARILGPRGLMPNIKMGTLLSDGKLLLQALRTEMAGQQVQYRTEKEGIVHLGIGKGSFTVSQLMDNVRTVMQELMDVKPETFGKTLKKRKNKKDKAPPKRGGANAGKKYFVNCHVTSTFGSSFRVDLRTIDPTNMLFMTALPTDQEDQSDYDHDNDMVVDHQVSLEQHDGNLELENGDTGKLMAMTDTNN